jgi:hypothetical protein
VLWTKSGGLHGKPRSRSLSRKLNQAKTHLYSHRWAGAGLRLGGVERQTGVPWLTEIFVVAVGILID